MVYVVQEPRQGPNGFTFDISPAMQYGALAFVFKSSENPSLTPGPSMFKARYALKEYCDADFILFAGGDPAGLTIVSIVAAEMNQGRVVVLRWERERDQCGRRTGRGFYIPVEIRSR